MQPDEPAAKIESDDEILSDHSDRDGDSSDDDDDNERLPARSARDRAFHIGVVLTTPRVSTIRVSQLFEDIDSGHIDLEPDYQRNVVWTKQKQSNLISSLLCHYFIPPILLSANATGSGTGTHYTCVDGKQRLSSIKNFMQNEIPVSDADKVTFYYSASDHGKRPLPGPVAKRFRNLLVPVISYDNLTEDQEREMFQRVQLGVSLSNAEKLSALATPWTAFFDELTKRYMDASRPGEHLCHVVKTARSKDWMVVAQAATLILNHDKPNIYGDHRQVKTFVQSEEMPRPSQRTQVIDALNRMQVLANEPELNLPLFSQVVNGSTKKQLSPVEFVFVAYMCWKYPTATLDELSDWTAQMRIEVHTKYPGQVRYHNTCAATLRGLADSFRPAAGTQRKRRRDEREQEEDADDDDEDYRPDREPERQRRRRAVERPDASADTRATRPASPPFLVASRSDMGSSSTNGPISSPVSTTRAREAALIAAASAAPSQRSSISTEDDDVPLASGSHRSTATTRHDVGISSSASGRRAPTPPSALAHRPREVSRIGSSQRSSVSTEDEDMPLAAGARRQRRPLFFGRLTPDNATPGPSRLPARQMVPIDLRTPSPEPEEDVKPTIPLAQAPASNRSTEVCAASSSSGGATVFSGFKRITPQNPYR